MDNYQQKKDDIQFRVINGEKFYYYIHPRTKRRYSVKRSSIPNMACMSGMCGMRRNNIQTEDKK